MELVMNMTKMIIFIIFVSTCHYAKSEVYICSIVNVFGLNDNGYFVTHGWKGNYVKRQFRIDNETGRVLNTTALKTRLSNENEENKPVVISSNNNSNSLKVSRTIRIIKHMHYFI